MRSISKLWKRDRANDESSRKSLYRSASNTSLKSFEGSIDLSDSSRGQQVEFLNMKIDGLQKLVKIREKQCNEKDVKIKKQESKLQKEEKENMELEIQMEEMANRCDNLSKQLKVKNEENVHLRLKLQSMEDLQRKTGEIEMMVKFLAQNQGYCSDGVPEPIRDITTRMGKLIGEDWFLLGIALGISSDTLNKINDLNASPQRKFERLIVDWTREKDDWDASCLLKALEVIKKDPLNDGPLSDREKDILTVNRNFLIENLTEACVKSICDHMFSRGVISMETKSTILQQPLVSRKTTKLLCCLEQCPEGTLGVFLEILKECGNTFIADKFMGVPTQVYGEGMTSPVHAPVQETGDMSFQIQNQVRSTHVGNTEDVDKTANQTAHGEQKTTNCQGVELETCVEEIPFPNEVDLFQTGVGEKEAPHYSTLTDGQDKKGNPAQGQDPEKQWDGTGDLCPLAECCINLKERVQTCSHPMIPSESLECKVFMKLFFWFVNMLQLYISQKSETVLHQSPQDCSKPSPFKIQSELNHPVGMHAITRQRRKPNEEVSGIMQMNTTTGVFNKGEAEVKEGSICSLEHVESGFQVFVSDGPIWTAQLELESIVELLLTHVGAVSMPSSNELEIEAKGREIFNILVNYVTLVCDNEDIPEDKSSQLKEHLLLFKDLLKSLDHNQEDVRNQVYWTFRKPVGKLLHT